METIDIQSRSFVVRWIKCSQGDVISYQVKPLKKSIELGIYKKPKSSIDDNANSAVHIAPDTRALLNYTTKSFLHRNSSASVDDSGNSSTSSVNSLNGSHDSRKIHGSLSLSNIQQQSQEIPVREKLTAAGFTMVQWIGNVRGGEMQQGLLEVKDDDYYYAFILDNTSAKNAKRKILFNAKAIHDNDPISGEKGQYPLTSASKAKAGALKKPIQDDILSVGRGRYLQGYLLKKRRKKLQGFKKRFFSLDFKYNTLSYYLNDHNQTCRGEIVINLSTVSANKKDKLIIIDSGMELWVLKSKDTATWSHWVNALQTCYERPRLGKPSPRLIQDDQDSKKRQREIFNSLRIDKKDPSMVNVPLLAIDSKNSQAPLPHNPHSDFTSTLKLIQQRVEQCKIDSAAYEHKEPERTKKSRTSSASSVESNVHPTESCDSVHSLVISPGTKEQKHPLYRKLAALETYLHQLAEQSETMVNEYEITKQISENRVSSSSAFSDNDEFFDAENEIHRGVILLDNDETLDGTISDRITETENGIEEKSDATSSDFSSKDLYPLPWKKQVKRRSDVQAAVASPPSLLSFLRKNVGKDLSSVAMPVTSNEPISILQMISETFEYSDLLTKAIESSSKSQMLAYVSAFAISCLSIHRDKTRALRKPFNPLLCETYELVREDMGYRLLAEKVSHRPPIFAFHAEHADWECCYNVSPLQRFWGKSVELNNEGTFRLRFKKSKETFEWVQPTTMLKNLIAGERYVEPINEFEILSSSSGSSTIAFQAAGMFGGRSEQLTLQIEPVGEAKKTIHGKWTESLVDDKSSTLIWKVGNLVPESKKKYGFTEFTANLNEITDLERGHLPPTDSRLRPDIRAYELGDVEKAEALKLKLEQLQRDRRNNGVDVKPRYFEKSKNGIWRVIQGPDNYWERRKSQNWSNVKPLW